MQSELKKYEWKAYKWAAKRGIAYIHKDLAKALHHAFKRGQKLRESKG